MEDKKAIRKQVFASRAEKSAQELIEPSRRIFETVRGSEAYQSRERIYAYMDFRNEVQTVEFIKRAWEDGKRVAVPRVNGRDMDFFELTDFSSLGEGYFGIPEPVCGDKVEWDDALMIVPGVAFDRAKHRVGYGQGFYDRFLSSRPGIYKIAVAFEFQVFDSVPFEELDILMDELVTENGRLV